jgi:hypothetical protein
LHTYDDVKRAALRAMLDEGQIELDAGLGVETSPEDLIAEVLAEMAHGSVPPLR